MNSSTRKRGKAEAGSVGARSGGRTLFFRGLELVRGRNGGGGEERETMQRIRENE